MIRNIILVGLGGAIGSILRYLTAVLVSKYLHTTFPLGTLVVNLLGCFLIGLFLGAFERQILSSDLRVLLTVGFCGGYTTFSTFAAENLQLLQNGQWGTLLLYTIGSIVVGVLAVWLGWALCKA